MSDEPEGEGFWWVLMVTFGLAAAMAVGLAWGAIEALRRKARVT